jgi:hypothetical protein
VNEAHGHYAYEIHGAAEEHHRHYDTESDLRELRSLVAGLREDLGRAEDRIRDLEGQTPQARQLQQEADLTAADLAESGFGDYYGPDCECEECYDPGPDEHGPGPQADAGRELEP